MFPQYKTADLLRTEDAALALPERQEEEDPTNRRDLFRLGGQTLAGGITAALARGPNELWQTLDSATVGPSRLAVLRRAADQLGEQVVKLPPATLLQDTIIQLSSVHDLLRSRQPTAVQQELARTSAKLATVVGEILFNLNQFSLAANWYAAAGRAAEEAGDRYLADIALAGSTYLPTYSQDPQAVLGNVMPRLEGSPPATAAIAWLWAFAAKAYADLGQRHMFEAAINASQEALDRCPPGSSRPGIFSFLPEKKDLYEAYGYGVLGNADKAADAAARSLARYDLTDTTEPALVRFEHAAALARAGEKEEACRLAVTTIEDPRTYPGVAVVWRARRFDTLLGDEVCVAVREWRERLRGFRVPRVDALPVTSATDS
ncbi:hypothetical protein C1I98_21575 [Spongiactinospora gelatinilytica]|uniref:Transcriptional regulator n=1 Tax=Spongiactinospora gelatinilytica TaxID=2666298 RepID=A0A2W2FUS1_9ACTN|nr:hypothetical protein [Spongiactinospora gelatinilytica]PZG41216.1 hypothetical protein C1I98_21575 [Spongiactinospora gelatinilytica]